MPRSELKLQGEICKSVNDHGGFARKLSHRFLVGVPDLLIKVPEFPTMLAEIKQQGRPVTKTEIRPAVTVQQHRFLKAASDAGILAVVMSFVNDPAKRQVGMRIVDIRGSSDGKYCTLLDDHRWFSIRDRQMVIWNEIVKFLKEINDGERR